MLPALLNQMACLEVCRIDQLLVCAALAVALLLGAHPPWCSVTAVCISTQLRAS